MSDLTIVHTNHVTDPDAIRSIIAQSQALLTEAQTAEELSAALDRSEALRAIIKRRGMELEIENQAAELRVQTERKVGEFLSGVTREPGRRDGEQTPYQRTLSELSISEEKALRWQRLSEIPTEAVTGYFEHCHEEEEEITTNGLLNLTARNGEVEVFPSQEVPYGIDARPKGGNGKVITGRFTRVSFVDVSTYTAGEQEEMVWEACDLAHRIGKAEPLDASIREKGMLPGYWLTMALIDAMADARLMVAEQEQMTQAAWLEFRLMVLASKVELIQKERTQLEMELEHLKKEDR